ncbi:MAG: hypothetical protein JW994_00635 [Candidatus Omnitrophica bacterium]|nr:hypothetical protein [Candidatus Omnitrophota bacterium]
MFILSNIAENKNRNTEKSISGVALIIFIKDNEDHINNEKPKIIIIVSEKRLLLTSERSDASFLEAKIN